VTDSEWTGLQSPTAEIVDFFEQNGLSKECGDFTPRGWFARLWSWLNQPVFK
jgi:hypothetical protein